MMFAYVNKHKTIYETNVKKRFIDVIKYIFIEKDRAANLLLYCHPYRIDLGKKIEYWLVCSLKVMSKTLDLVWFVLVINV